MRIIHFSDFHLNGRNLNDAEHNLKYLIKAFTKINEEKKIDLILFTGDMLERGGKGYNDDLKVGFEAFSEKVIRPILNALGLNDSRFIFTPGNHDIDRDADNPRMEAGIEKDATTAEGIIGLTKSSDVGDFTKRINAFKSFEKSYYKSLGITYKYGRFVSTFELDIDGLKVGISSLNTVWRCGVDDAHKIALGINQITENNDHLENKDLRIALTHYPISFLKECEREEVRQLCAKHFDIVFNGHSHGGYVNFQAPYRHCAFFEINASGSLAANIYEHNNHYKNAFQVVDCETGGKYDIQTYTQIKYEEFELDREEFPDGHNVRIYPDQDQLKALYERQQLLLKKDEEDRIKHSIEPFELLSDFVNRSGNTVMKSKFVTSEGIAKVMDGLRLSDRDCRFMALSGMGKTRIIAETFKDQSDVYYSREGNSIQGLQMLLRYCNPKIVIIDNCSLEYQNEALKCIDESGKKVRLITVHNVLTPKEQATPGERFELNYKDTEEVVEKMIAAEENICSDENLSSMIKERSGRIPYMTLLLIQAYKKNHNLTIENPEKVLGAILSGNITLDENKERALKAISIFEPLGCEAPVDDEYQFVTHNDKIHHITLNQDVVDRLFADTVQEFVTRQLIEKDGYCIRLRPKPLAEWLTESWLIEYGNGIADVIDDIRGCAPGLEDRLFRAMNSRIKEMTESSYAAKVFDLLNNPGDGSFHDERIAFSKAGSQLFLSMGLVSPVMVAKNLLSLIGKKSVEWLRTTLDTNARRNLVWALENICMNVEAFMDGGKSLAKLALAENESIANNATGQFKQLFHLVLSGTRADLKTRVSLLLQLRVDDAYLPLVVKAIDSAFVSRGFYRSYTSGAPKLSDTPDDYVPAYDDVHYYWRDCALLLKNITEQDANLLNPIMNILPGHVSDFANMNEMPLLYELIEYYGEKVDWQWPEMRDMLSMYLNHWCNGSEGHKQEVRKWMDRLAPKSFLGRLNACIKDSDIRINGDYDRYERLMSELMSPFAEEFVGEGVYRSAELNEIITDEKLRSYWFAKEAIALINKDQMEFDFLDCLLDAIKKEPKDFCSNIVKQMVSEIKNKDAVNAFRHKLDAEGYFALSASVTGILDDETHSQLNVIIEGWTSGRYDAACVNHYLSQYRYWTLQRYFEVFEEMRKAEISEKDVCFPFILGFSIPYRIGEQHKMLYVRMYQEILLSFNFSDSYPYLSREVVEAMIHLLETYEDPEFAKKVHEKAVHYLITPNCDVHPFEHLYFALLPKYQDVILDNLCDVLAKENDGMLFYYNMYSHLGSGFGMSSGPLFQCNEDRLKVACLKHPSVLPSRFAHMCPVFEFRDDKPMASFSKFFLWLCDNFGNQKEMLQAFSSNMGTYSWSGVNGFSDYLAKRIPCLQPLTEHVNESVREWAKSQLERVREQVVREQGKEAYERMVMG